MIATAVFMMGMPISCPRLTTAAELVVTDPLVVQAVAAIMDTVTLNEKVYLPTLVTAPQHMHYYNIS